MPMVAQPLRELPEPRKLTTDLWQFTQKTRWQVLAVCAMVVQQLVYRSHLITA
jgi:hypothetical protein